MNTRKGMGVTPTNENNWDKLSAYSENYKGTAPRKEPNPDLQVGDVHKVRIMRDIDKGEYGIYFSEVKQVFKNFYMEEVSFPKTQDRPASKRTICFPIVDHRFGIGSCNLNGDDLDN
jgi:hypothetical protein